MIIETRSAEETYQLGYEIGGKATSGQVYTMVGDLGVGKTVFTQGMAKGLAIEEPISSPTFTIVQVYDEGRLPFYHFDVYRIGDIEEMDEIMKSKFIETFEKIRVEFKEVFKKLFKGGDGVLELTDPEDILNTGIEISALPPGKKLNSIALLSGGEKTLTTKRIYIRFI